VHCPAGTQRRYQTLCVSLAAVTSLRRREVASKKTVRDITRISCFVTACITDLFNSFCEKVYAVAIFNVVQQQLNYRLSGKFNYMFVGR